MSVSIEHPRHLSASPTFSSPPHSPTGLRHAQAPTSPPSIDANMSTPTSTIPPAGQRHDRQDADMNEEEGLTNVPAQLEQAPAVSVEPASNASAIDVAAVGVATVDEDAMDTTPDTDRHFVLPPGSASQVAVSAEQPPIPTTEGVDRGEDIVGVQTGPVIASENAMQSELAHQTIPPPLFDPSLHPPPPPPPPVEPARSESDSSDDEDGMHPWHAVQEDTSSPDELELKEIEASSEHSALDHEYWESRAFPPVEEPEYTAGDSGRIHWTIDAYNGTREHPNRDIVMKSEPVTVGGHQWQIKFYPKGNDSDYLSVYLECLSVVDPASQKKEGRVDSVAKDGPGEGIIPGSPAKAPEPEQSTPVEFQYNPLPLLGSKQLLKRKSVAAQVSVVMYNPTEPRVNYSRTALHRFCNGSSDWGWTRFHGPYYEISHRLRGQRQALLRNDKLAFTGYVRIIEDETDCLWEHHSRENPWDSFAMTGLQGLMLGEDASAPGGNMISAVASLMLFKPFRKLLYGAHAPDPEKEPFAHPKPLLSALQKVLYMLRTQVDPGTGAIALDDVLDALEWYGIHERIDKLDVIETWEVLRAKLEQELQDTPEAALLEAICGPKQNHNIGVPSYRVPVVGAETMQDAINKSAEFIQAGQDLPQLLTIELERQEFDSKTRSYVKLMNKVTLDDHVTVSSVRYTLYGFIVHKQTLQSYVYQPIIRPGGPDSRWYSYSDSKDENHVKCLTKNQAIDAHEGKPSTDRIFGNDAVAYVAMYVREDVAEFSFNTSAESEEWEVPKWIQTGAEKMRSSSSVDSLPPPPPDDEPATSADSKDNFPNDPATVPTETALFQVINSRCFLQHEGPGIFDAYASKWATPGAEDIHEVQLSRRDSCDMIRGKIASVIDDVKDPRQIRFWFLDPIRGSQGRPNLLGTGKVEYSSGSYDRYAELKEWVFDQSSFACCRVWVHVVAQADLPALPQVEDTVDDTVDPQTDAGDDNVGVTDLVSNASHAPEIAARSEDTPMSEPDELPTVPAIPESSRPQTPTSVPPANIAGFNEEVVETIQTEPMASEPHILEVSAVPVDTSMGGTQDDPLPPPPPPDLMPSVPPPDPAPPADEIYFFLKQFCHEKQTLESRGTYIVKKSASVDETLVTCLGLPMEDKKNVDIWEEQEMNILRPVKNRRTFAQVDLHSTSIIIVALPQTSEQRDALATRAKFADPRSFLAYRTFARNFPAHLNGHFTYNYFSSEYYKGDIRNGHRHGHGSMFYHSGATYEGDFQLGQRHGHGLYTFQNGDTYDGNWVDNQQHGSGIFVEAATGNMYVGGWKNDKKFGEGVTHWKNAQEAERLCRICWEDAADAAFYDCGHVVACLQCAREMQNCPVCRKRVLCAMKLYYVA